MVLISIIIPTLNEAQGIKNTLRDIPRKELESIGFETEIIVVDGESVDDTVKIAMDEGANVIVEPRRGYGRAYKSGFSKASGDIFVTFDADGTYPSQSIHNLIKELDNYDFISTNRFSKMEKDAMSSRNKFGNYVLSFFSKVLFGLPMEDSQSGMWIFRAKVWESIAAKVKSDGMAFSQEIKIEAYRNGFECTEIDIEYKRRKGTVKLNAFRDGIGNFLHLFQKRLNC
jgi:glycosyltransferase involved in cell wall biosynthesis